jgi:FtsP/CotA-like multicopper oxidase with cupredoxin domain
MQTDILGIAYYGDTLTTPNTTAFGYNDSCSDMTAEQLVPYVSKTVGSAAVNELETLTLAASDNLFYWYLNDSTFDSSWDNPTLLQVWDNATAFNATQNVLQLPGADEWVYLVINNGGGVAHPIHLHGMDFYVLSQGAGAYSSDTVTLSLGNPPRRDVAMLAGGGYLVLGFITDNPGAWLMHCHIGWHTLEGLALQFLVRQDELVDLIDYDALNATCAAWDAWQVADDVAQAEDDGI